MPSQGARKEVDLGPTLMWLFMFKARKDYLKSYKQKADAQQGARCLARGTQQSRAFQTPQCTS